MHKSYSSEPSLNAIFFIWGLDQFFLIEHNYYNLVLELFELISKTSIKNNLKLFEMRLMNVFDLYLPLS